MVFGAAETFIVTCDPCHQETARAWAEDAIKPGSTADFNAANGAASRPAAGRCHDVVLTALPPG
jgi:hypothetical protein